MLLLTGLTGIAACCTPGGDLPPLPDATLAAYRIGPEDQLRVTVFNDPRLTGDFRVSDAGAIALPLIGTVRAAGLTTTELERAVEKEMKDKNLFRDPSAAVQVITYRPVFVLGMVERGGQFPYQPGMTSAHRGGRRRRLQLPGDQGLSLGHPHRPRWPADGIPRPA